MRTLQDKVAVVTGAGSGIGRALAVALAGSGATVALLDRNEAGLAETAALLPGSTLSRRVDVAEEQDVQDAAAAVVQRYGHVDLVINNAGIAHAGRDFVDLPAEDFRRVVDVNFWGVVHGTRAFLPHLVRRPEAAVVNLSSLFGLMGVGRQSGYCASKFAVRGFTESLRMELRVSAPHVRAVSVHPGGVKTAIARHSLRAGQSADEHARDAEAFDRIARTSPEQAAATVLRGVLAGRERVLVGPDARALDLLVRALPLRYTALVLRATAGTDLALPVTPPVSRAVPPTA